jgi:hypothetical protein
MNAIVKAKNRKKLPTIISIVLIFLVVLIYFGYVFKISINIPFWDEFDSLCQFIDFYINKSFPKNLTYLFGQANEHRNFSYRLTLLLQYLILGRLNFRAVILLGNLGMIWLIYLLYKLNPVFKTNLLTFIPVVLLLFVPQNELSDWGMVTWNSIIQYSLVLTSLYFLNKHGSLNFAIATFFAIIATFSFGNGMLTFVVGFIILLQKEKKSMSQITLWTAFMLVSIIFYFYHYHSATGIPSKLDVLKQPINAVLFFFTIWGNLFSALLNRELILYAIVGVLIFMFLCFLIIKKWNIIKNYPLLSSYLTFFLLTASMATISRVGLGVVEASASRYMLLPILFVAIIYILTLYCYEFNKGIMFLILASSLLLYVARIHQQHYAIVQHRDRLSEGLVSYYKDPDNTSLPYPNQKRASEILSTSIAKGYFNPPPLSVVRQTKKWIEDKIIIPETTDIQYYLDSVGSDSRMIQITGWAILKEKNKNNQRIGIILSSVKDTFFFETTIIRRMDVIEYFKKEYPDIINDCGINFSLNWKKYGIVPGNYKIGIGIIKNDQLSSYINTNQVLNLSNNPAQISGLMQSKKWIADKTIIPETTNFVYYLDSVGSDKQMIQINGWAFLKEKNIINQQIGITLSSSTDTLFFGTTLVPRIDVVEYFKKEYTDMINDCGFNFSLNWPENGIRSGQYKIGICIIKDYKLTSYANTNRVLNLNAK